MCIKAFYEMSLSLSLSNLSTFTLPLMNGCCCCCCCCDDWLLLFLFCCFFNSSGWVYVGSGYIVIPFHFKKFLFFFSIFISTTHSRCYIDHNFVLLRNFCVFVYLELGKEKKRLFSLNSVLVLDCSVVIFVCTRCWLVGLVCLFFCFFIEKKKTYCTIRPVNQTEIYRKIIKVSSSKHQTTQKVIFVKKNQFVIVKLK